MELISWITFLFFLFALAVYWSLPRKAKAPFLCVAGFSFYGLMQPLGGVVALVFLWVVLLFQRLILAADSERGKKVLLIVGAIVSLIPMVMYKYRYSLLGSLPGLRFFAELPLVAPVGISYFTFRAVHFLIETRRGKIGFVSGIDFFYFMTFVPTVVAGPIERYGAFSEQSRSIDRFDPDLFGEGLKRIAVGLVKKLVLADMVYEFIKPFMTTPTNLGLSTPQLWLCLHGYYLYLYMDFSGYSDIAIGLSRLFGFRIMENFNWPILAPNIREFWRRWHISLTSWLTEYVYYGLGGNRKGAWRAELNTMITMLVIALWHGSQQLQHYFIWGIYLTLGLVVFRQWGRLKKRFFPGFIDNPTTWGRALGIFMTIQYMNLSWPIFLFDTRVAIIMYLKIFGLVG